MAPPAPGHPLEKPTGLIRGSGEAAAYAVSNLPLGSKIRKCTRCFNCQLACEVTTAVNN